MTKQYFLPVKSEIEVNVDFAILYNYIREYAELDDPDDIYTEFGDNIIYYLNNTPGLNISIDEDLLDEDCADEAEDEIWHGFGQWIDDNIM